jgi:hypothetical protein
MTNLICRISTNSASRSPNSSLTNVSLSVLKFSGASAIVLLDVKDALSGRDLRTTSFEDRTGELTSNIPKESRKNEESLM